MYSGLDQKYKKITQLKEEFNEIKTLFGKKKENQVNKLQASAKKQEEIAPQIGPALLLNQTEETDKKNRLYKANVFNHTSRSNIR